jgi:hypothetical protein
VPRRERTGKRFNITAVILVESGVPRNALANLIPRNIEISRLTYPGYERSPSISPDGRKVAFSWNGEQQDNFDIYVKLVGPGPPAAHLGSGGGCDAGVVARRGCESMTGGGVRGPTRPKQFRRPSPWLYARFLTFTHVVASGV